MEIPAIHPIKGLATRGPAAYVANMIEIADCTLSSETPARSSIANGTTGMISYHQLNFFSGIPRIGKCL